MPGAVVSAVVMALLAMATLAPEQVRAEVVPAEAEEVVCDGLGSLTMDVNTLTLQRQGELTKQRQSIDGKCRMSLTLVDVSSEDNPADRTKTCTVTAAPRVYGHAVEIVPSESGECDTVDYYVDLDLDNDYLGDTVWAPHSGDSGGETFGSGDQSVSGASGSQCIFQARGDYVHVSGRDVSAHGWWRSVTPRYCPEKAGVSVWLQSHRCYSGNRVCWWQTIRYKREKIGAKNLTNRRVTARRTCSTYVYTGFRSVVHAKPDGVPGKTVITLYRNLPCRL